MELLVLSVVVVVGRHHQTLGDQMGWDRGEYPLPPGCLQLLRIMQVAMVGIRIPKGASVVQVALQVRMPILVVVVVAPVLLVVVFRRTVVKVVTVYVRSGGNGMWQIRF